MNQTKLASFIEAIANTVAGFIFSFTIQKILNYFYGIHMSNETAVWFVFWFTVASVVRSYIIRRLWNSEFWKRFAYFTNRQRVASMDLYSDREKLDIMKKLETGDL